MKPAMIKKIYTTQIERSLYEEPIQYSEEELPNIYLMLAATAFGLLWIAATSVIWIPYLIAQRIKTALYRK